MNIPVIHQYDFIIPIAPASMQKGARVNMKQRRFYTDPKKVAFFASIKEEISHIIPPEPLRGMLSIGFKFYFERPASRQSTDESEATPLWGYKGTDVDNCCKSVTDSMTKSGFWVNDSQIWRILGAEKYYCEGMLFPRIEVIVQDHGMIYNEKSKPTTKRRKSK